MMLLRRLVRRTRRIWPGSAGRIGSTHDVAPVSATIDLDDPSISIDPFPWYERMRREANVLFLPRHDCWIVLGYEAAKHVCAHPELFSSAPYEFIDGALLAADPPRHGPVRRLVSRSFGGETLGRLAARAEAFAAGLLRPELDVVRDFARPLSRAIAGELIGFDSETLATIEQAELAGASKPHSFQFVMATVDAVAERAAMFDTLAKDQAGLLDRDAVRSVVRLLWFASTATTERTISHCVLCLLRDKPLHRRLIAQPGLIQTFVEEVVRLHPPELLIRRVASVPVQLQGVEIPQGGSVQLCLAAANRDPAYFDAPAELRLERTSAETLSFGSGIHHCVGAPMTRRVVPAAMAAFLRASVNLRPLEPPDEVAFVHAMMVLAPRKLNVAL